YCAGARASRRAATCGRATAIFSRRRPSGSSAACGWRGTGACRRSTTSDSTFRGLRGDGGLITLPPVQGKENILNKLRQIEDQARQIGADSPDKVSRDRARLIISLSGFLRTEVEMRWSEAAANQPYSDMS